MTTRLELCLFGLLLATGLSSCVKEVVMDAGETPQVVVACILTDEPEQTLRLSFTKGASLSEAPLLTEATAALYDGEEMVGRFQHKRGEEWTLSYAAVTGHDYRLEVEVPGYDKIWAEQTMPEPPALQCVGYTHFVNCIEPLSGWVYPFGEPERPDGISDITINPRLWPEDEPYPDFETYYVLLDSKHPVWIYAMNYDPKTGRHEMAQEICTDAVADSCNLLGKVYEPLKKDCPNPWHFRKEYGGSEVEAAFYAAHQMELYPNLAGKAMHDRYIRILPGRQIFSLSGSFEGEYCRRQPGNDYRGDYPVGSSVDGISSWTWGYAQDVAEDEGYILCMTYSEEFEKYLFESGRYQQIRASTDLSTIYLRDNIFTNIRGGGIGIFGAATRRKYPWGRTYVYVDSGIPHVGYFAYDLDHYPYPTDRR